MKLVIIIVIAFVLLIPVSAFAQSYTGVLKLDSIPSNFKEGGIITFSGTLTTTNGKFVSDATIYIKDDVDFGRDSVMGTITTDKSGKFSATWKAVSRTSGSYDFYAIYEGGGDVSKSRSATYTVTVSGTSSSSGYSENTSYSNTKITLDRFVNSAKIGQMVTFSGQLTANGNGLDNSVVYIKDEDFADFNDVLITTTTDSNGKFSGTWKVKNVDSKDRQFSSLILDLYGGFGGATQLNHIYNIAEANTVEVYAEFVGNNKYSKSKTCLIENVDGVRQENCNNRILSIQDDSSFKNLIVSTVLNEMGVSTSGVDSLESILSNQADTTDAANFENFLLKSLQDELELGNTDLSITEMLELLENPSLATKYNTSPSYPTTTVPKPTPKITTNLDYDNDGIPDFRDKCKYVKENYNGYEDTDGCLDIKPIITTTKPLFETYNPQFDMAEAVKAKQAYEAKQKQEAIQKQLQKQEVQVLQKQSYDKLAILKNDISVSEQSLKQMTSNSDEQKKILDKAWNLLKNTQELQSQIEDRYEKGDDSIGFTLYDNAKMYYNLHPGDSENIGDNLKEISKLVDQAQKIKPKTCFLFWCW